MQARHIMTVPVVTVAPDTTVPEIARILIDKRISAVPVTDTHGRMLGIVSEGDLLRRPEIGTEPHRSWWLDLIRDPSERASEYVKMHGLKASDVMTRNVVTVSPSTSVGEIAALLERRHIKRVPVVESGHVTGIVSRANIVRSLASQKPKASLTSATDSTAREKLLNLLKTEGLTVGETVNPIVVDGVIHLWGTVRSQQEHDAIRVAAESIVGAGKVENHLSILRWPAAF